LDGFEGAITLVDFLESIAGMEGAKTEEVLIQLRAEIEHLADAAYPDRKKKK
jgi:hypothetical protein